jgi:hypothetical protein
LVRSTREIASSRRDNCASSSSASISSPILPAAVGILHAMICALVSAISAFQNGRHSGARAPVRRRIELRGVGSFSADIWRAADGEGLSDASERPRSALGAGSERVAIPEPPARVELRRAGRVAGSASSSAVVD